MAIISSLPRQNPVLNKVIANVPSQSGTLTYNSYEQSPTWNNYNPDQLEISSVVSATDAGAYIAAFTPKKGYVWSDKTKSTKAVSWQIQPLHLQAPAAYGSYVYNGNGQELRFSYYDSLTMEKSLDYVAINAGSYTARVSLRNTTNYVWSDGTTTAKDYAWSIAKADPVYTAPTAKWPTYNGTPQEVFNPGVSAHGTFYYSTTSSANWSASVPLQTDGGTFRYYWKLVSDANHNSVDVTEIRAGVLRAQIAKPVAPYQNIIYNGTVQTFQVNGYDENTMRKSGKWSATNAGNYQANISIGNSFNYEWDDGTQTSLFYFWAIGKATPSYTVPTARTPVYNGTTNTNGTPQDLVNPGATSDGTIYYSLDNSTWAASIPQRTNAGTYTVYWKLDPDSNHLPVYSTSISVTIARKGIAKVTANTTSFTYTGSAQSPSVSGYSSNMIARSGTYSATNAGDYSVSYTPLSNFQWFGGTTSAITIAWTIQKATLSIPTSSGTYTYTGSAQSLTFTGYDSATMTKGGTYTATNAGSYTATISLKDTSNYQWSDESTAAKSYPWSIAKKSVTAPTSTGSYTYNGTAQSLTFVGFDSSTMTKGGTYSATNAGSYVANVSLKDTANCKWSDESTAAKSYPWSIAKANPATPTLSDSSFTFIDAEITHLVTVTRSGDGAISAVSSNTSIATCSVSGTTVYVTSKSLLGTATITITVAAGTNYNAYTGSGAKFSAINALDTDTCVSFSSAGSFTLQTMNQQKNWDGTLYWSDGTKQWAVWDGGSTLSAAKVSGDISYRLRLRGSDNTTLTGITSSTAGQIYSRGLYLYSTASPTQYYITAGGYIESLLQYDLEKPPMAAYAFAGLFYNNLYLREPPLFSGSDFSEWCCKSMYERCTNMTRLPKIKSLVFPAYCCAAMFADCSNIVISNVLTQYTPYSYRIPDTGTGTVTGNNPFYQMAATTFSSDPTVNTTYYVTEKPREQ